MKGIHVVGVPFSSGVVLWDSSLQPAVCVHSSWDISPVETFFFPFHLQVHYIKDENQINIVDNI